MSLMKISTGFGLHLSDSLGHFETSAPHYHRFDELFCSDLIKLLMGLFSSSGYHATLSIPPPPLFLLLVFPSPPSPTYFKPPSSPVRFTAFVPPRWMVIGSTDLTDGEGGELN